MLPEPKLPLLLLRLLSPAKQQVKLLLLNIANVVIPDDAGDTVLDPFLGGGLLARATVLKKRRFIGL
ncbi:MAG: hypothetical protein D3921_15295, partial [Candidatus Electrothrix sp. AW1]|nr:hypothetical protein [Candidatus Electrothrix gigas]